VQDAPLSRNGVGEWKHNAVLTWVTISGRDCQMNRIQLFLAGALVISACSRDSQTTHGLSSSVAPIIEFRLAYEAPRPGLQRIDHGVTSAFMEAEPILSNTDLEAVRAHVRNSGVIVQIDFEDKGAAKLRAATGRSVGNMMALLIDGRVVSLVTIADTIEGSSPTTVAIDLPSEEADRLARAISRAWSSASGVSPR
jgi:hypothetical protein